MKQYVSTPKRRRLSILVLVAVILLLLVGVAYAAAVTFVDDNGADDVPGQKDLNQMTSDQASLPTSLAVTWNWDDTAWSGNNTGDACSLYDTDGDGFANYALCVTVGGTPAVYQSTTLYSCGDSRSDRCDQPTTPVTTFSSTCYAVVEADADPFGVPASSYFDPTHVTGNTCSDTTACYTDDTVASCTVTMTDVGGGTVAKLINVCTYPSQEPNSDPSDCVVSPNNGFLEIVKVADPDDETPFVFTLNPASEDETTQFTIIGSGTTDPFSAAPKTYSITEAVPVDWSLTDASCLVNGVPTGSFDSVTHAVTGIEVKSGQSTICTFTDKKGAWITINKLAKNLNGVAYCPDRFFNFSLTSNPGFSLYSTECPAPRVSSVTYPVMPNTDYTIAETDPDINTLTGWQLTSVICSGGSSGWTWAPGATSVTGQVAPGGTAVCTFTNQQMSDQAVTLASFDAALAGKAVKLTWMTTSEIDNSGFNLYRKSKSGPLRKLNAVLIAAQQPGSNSGHTYTYIDKTAKPGQTYKYYLDDVSMEGVATRHGPVEITLPKGK